MIDSPDIGDERLIIETGVSHLCSAGTRKTCTIQPARVETAEDRKSGEDGDD